ncbi:hypothetical protein [Roseburia faecis]|uniref:hypothetical protein n=1 Tax=Roseburia faecis TaxID=301302 RepID=UPI0032C0C0ED
MKTGQIIRKAVLQLLQEYEFRVAEAKKALNDFCACSPNDLDNFDILNAKFEDAKKHQFDVADKLAFMLSRYADQLAFSDDPLAETLDDLIALAASEETLTAPADAPEDSPVDAPADAPEDSPVDAPADAPEDAPVDALTDAPADVPVNCLLCRYFGDPDPFDPEHRQPLQCCFAPDEDYDDMPCADTPADSNSRSPAPRARASPL